VTAPTTSPAGGWRTATVREVAHPAARAVVLRLDVADRVVQLAGQHYVVRLTAEDGYVAQRSYSVASAPGDRLVELYVERLDDGEVSTYLADVVEVGDTLEVRGPIGGWFVWDGATPALAIGGGSGVVPLVAMLRHAVQLGRTDLLHLAAAARSIEELPYADELMAAGAAVAFSRSVTPGGRPAGRLDGAEIAALVDPAATCFVCGSAGFAEFASSALVAAGVDPPMIRVERFGPSS
jgi:ferredoxin-NADP reductase